MSAPDQNSDELNAHLRQLRGLIYGNWRTCVTCAFAELNLADLLAAGEHPGFYRTLVQVGSVLR